MKKYRLIALYLPQYHPIEENNEWWGEGFTEWVNVASAKPLYKGHLQPNIPADLGFYDLRLSESRIAQAEMAKRYGIEGFCYWHYWFGGNERLLNKPFEEVLKSKTPNFPFCLAWANHSWYAKTWNNDSPDKLLKEQKYLGVDDYTKHFYEMLPAFKDERYITVDGKLFFLIFSPLSSSEIKVFIKTWRELAKKNELNDFYFVGQGLKESQSSILEMGFNAFQDNSLFSIYKNDNFIKKTIKKLAIHIFKRPAKIYDYSKAVDNMVSSNSKDINVIPCICPNWDHSPRSKERALILKNSTPQNFKNHVMKVLRIIKDKPEENRIAIIKSWNEWGEGNYLEPDLKYGKQYLESLYDCIKYMNNDNTEI